MDLTPAHSCADHEGLVPNCSLAYGAGAPILDSFGLVVAPHRCNKTTSAAANGSGGSIGASCCETPASVSTPNNSIAFMSSPINGGLTAPPSSANTNNCLNATVAAAAAAAAEEEEGRDSGSLAPCNTMVAVAEEGATTAVAVHTHVDDATANPQEGK